MNNKKNKPNNPQNIIEIDGNPKGLVFIAAVKFERKRVELVKAPGFEKNTDLNTWPSMTWWWYEVDMEPKTALSGSWDITRMITLNCRHHLAKLKDISWVGIIARDSSGKEKWINDYIIRDGKILDPYKEQVIGDEDNINNIVERYRIDNGLL